MIERFLQLLARRVLDKYKPQIIAITGSVGKSSTKNACAELLSEKKLVHGDIDSIYNDSISLPLVILGMKKDARNTFGILWACIRSIFFYHGFVKYPEVLVLELRARKPGDLKRSLDFLGEIDIGIFTGFPDNPVHSEFYDTASDLFKEKSQMLGYIKKGGVVILNYDDERVMKLAGKAKKQHLKIKTIGFDNDADMYAESPVLDSDHGFFGEKSGPVGVSFKLHYGDSGQNTIPIRLPKIFSIHHVYPVLFGLSLAEEFDVNFVESSQQLLEYTSPPHRMQVVSGIKNSTIIDDTFNSSPASVEAALVSMTMMRVPGKKIVIFGDMLELGKQSKKIHAEIGAKISEVADTVVLYGENVLDVKKGVLDHGFDEQRIFHFKSKKSLIDHVVKRVLHEDDLVLVKGGRLLQMEEIVDQLKKIA